LSTCKNRISSSSSSSSSSTSSSSSSRRRRRRNARQEKQQGEGATAEAAQSVTEFYTEHCPFGEPTKGSMKNQLSQAAAVRHFNSLQEHGSGSSSSRSSNSSNSSSPT
jgi:hypothetical protein